MSATPFRTPRLHIGRRTGDASSRSMVPRRRSMSATTPSAALGFDAVVFDLDGVVKRTARLHAAWKDLFDDFLSHRAEARGEPFHAFDAEADYLTYVDGKPRYEGVRSFLSARGIVLREGDPTEAPDATTIHGLGRRRGVRPQGQTARRLLPSRTRPAPFLAAMSAGKLSRCDGRRSTISMRPDGTRGRGAAHELYEATQRTAEQRQGCRQDSQATRTGFDRSHTRRPRNQECR